MKTKSCFCFLFILSMITSSFGRPEPQFINNNPCGSSFGGQVSGQFINDNQYQTIKYGFQNPIDISAKVNQENGFSNSHTFNEYRKNAPCSVFQFGK